MKSIEIVELIKQTNPKLLGKMPDAKAAKIVAAVLHEISQQISGTDEGTLKIVGLGVFKIRQVEREKDDQKINVKKITFGTAKTKAKKEAE